MSGKSENDDSLLITHQLSSEDQLFVPFTERSDIVYEVQQWVALDDLNLSIDSQMDNHFVLTDPAVGINKERADYAIQLLLAPPTQTSLQLPK